jgi:hypothetical protein
MTTLRSWVIALASLAPLVAQSSYRGLSPGISTRPAVERVLGQPARQISTTLAEYPSGNENEKLFAQYDGQGVLDRLESVYAAGQDAAALRQTLGLGSPARQQTNQLGRLEEYYSPQLIVLTYASSDPAGPVARTGYFSRAQFDQAVASIAPSAAMPETPGLPPQPQPQLATGQVTLPHVIANRPMVSRPGSPSIPIPAPGATASSGAQLPPGVVSQGAGRPGSAGGRTTGAIRVTTEDGQTFEIPVDLPSLDGNSPVIQISPNRGGGAAPAFGEGPAAPAAASAAVAPPAAAAPPVDGIPVAAFEGTYDFSGGPSAPFKQAIIHRAGNRLVWSTATETAVIVPAPPESGQPDDLLTISYQFQGRPAIRLRFVISNGKVEQVVYAGGGVLAVGKPGR